MRMLLTVVFAIILSGCVTPPGKLKRSDFKSVNIRLDTSVSESASNLNRALRYCGPGAGSLSYVHYGVPQCSSIMPDGSMICDLYTGGLYGGRSNLVLGIITLTPKESGSSALLSVHTVVFNQTETLSAWTKFVQGREKEVCAEE